MNYTESREVYLSHICNTRRDRRSCTKVCWQDDPNDCRDYTCGDWQIGSEGPNQCPPPTKTPVTCTEETVYNQVLD